MLRNQYDCDIDERSQQMLVDRWRSNFNQTNASQLDFDQGAQFFVELLEVEYKLLQSERNADKYSINHMRNADEN